MHQKLRSVGLNVDRESVRLIVKSLDPEGVETRKAHRLKRRIYSCPGPNHIMHIDGYDKLKLFGFAILGAIDGYSRKILWLNVKSTNNDPSVTANHFFDYIQETNIVPRVIRTDRGSENVTIGGIQRYLRRNHQDRFSGNASFRYGTSTSNQRIESWWSQFRKSRSTWWINLFKDLRDNDLFDGSIRYHVDSIKFCFLNILQEELDETRRFWNSHRIRKVRNSECPAGRPDFIHVSPSHYGVTDGGIVISQGDLLAAKPFISCDLMFGCSREYVELAKILMYENGFSMPHSVNEAMSLYLLLISEIDNL